MTRTLWADLRNSAESHSMGKLKRPGRNVPCPCGSGRKYKNCHAKDNSTPGYWVITDQPGITIGPVSIKASYASAQDEPLPQWLLNLARRAAQEAARPEATHYDSLQTLVWTAMASEALANRLLEPLVAPDEWGLIERKPTQEKWSLLGEKVGVKPPLIVGEQPLQGVREVMNLRNELMHFKHGRNLERHEGAAIDLQWNGTGFNIDPDAILSQPIHQTAKSSIRAILDPKRASRYIEPLLATLSQIIPLYPPDQFNIATELAQILSQPLRTPSAHAWTRGLLRAGARIWKWLRVVFSAGGRG